MTFPFNDVQWPRQGRQAPENEKFCCPMTTINSCNDDDHEDEEGANIPTTSPSQRKDEPSDRTSSAETKKLSQDPPVRQIDPSRQQSTIKRQSRL